MKRLLLILACLLISHSAQAAHIFPVGDSILDGVYAELVRRPPTGYTIDTTGQNLVYAGKMLQHWTAGRGTGTCTQDAFYGCLEAADSETTIDVILIFELGFNDIFNWHLGTYGDMAAYLTAWRTFYTNMHTDFPAASIVHATGYPLRTENSGSQCGVDPYEFYGGDLSPAVSVPDCASAMECIHESNAGYRGFKDALIAANTDLTYVQYIDTWESIVDYFGTAAGVNAWSDLYVDTCVHINYWNLQSFWNDWLADDFGAAIGGTALLGTSGLTGECGIK